MSSGRSRCRPGSWTTRWRRSTRPGRGCAWSSGESCGLAVPAPRRRPAAEAHAADPALHAVERGVVGAPLEHRVPDLGGRQAGVEQRSGSLAQADQPELQRGVAEEGGLLERRQRGEQGLEVARPARAGLQDLALGARKPVATPGQVLQRAAQGRREVREGGGRGGGQRRQRGRVGRAEGRPGPPGEGELIGGDRGRDGRGRVGGGEERARQDGAHAARRGSGPGQRVERLQELQLVVEVVLEPQHDDLAVRGGLGQTGVAGGQRGLGLVAVGPAAGGQEGGPLGPQGRRMQAGADRTLVQHVVPRQHLVAGLRGAQPAPERVAVGDVQHGCRNLPVTLYPPLTHRSDPAAASTRPARGPDSVTDQPPRLQPVGQPDHTRQALESALFEVKRVIVGQDPMLERVFVALIAGGHVLLEGVPGLAKTLTVKTVAEVLGGSFRRIQFTPDLVPADLVGTRIYRPDTGGFDTELGPVFCNFLLADEINRAPAKVQSALLEVMQEHQVTIGHESHRVPLPFLVLATQNPIESEGTYPLPEAQVDRFMFKLVVGYPDNRDEVAVVERSLVTGADVREVLSPQALARHQRAAHAVFVDRRVMEYAVDLTTATREPGEENWVEFGASPRGSINLVHAGRALALLRGRDYVLPSDIRDVARDVLRHRIVLTYEALAAGIDSDRVLDDVLERVPMPRIELAEEGTRSR